MTLEPTARTVPRARTALLALTVSMEHLEQMAPPAFLASMGRTELMVSKVQQGLTVLPVQTEHQVKTASLDLRVHPGPTVRLVKMASTGPLAWQEKMELRGHPERTALTACPGRQGLQGRLVLTGNQALLARTEFRALLVLPVNQRR